MFNPYEVMYDSVMDVYRYQDKKDDAGFDASGESLVASSVKCRYSISNQGTAGSPVPFLQAANQLFCGLETDIREGETVNVFLYRIFALRGDSVQLIENEAVRDDFVII